MIQETQDARFISMLQRMLEENKLIFFIDQLDHVDQNKLQMIPIISGLEKVQIVLTCRRCLASQFSNVPSSRLCLYSLQMPSESVLLRSISPDMTRQSIESLPIFQLLSLCSNWHIVWTIYYLTSNQQDGIAPISHKKPL